MNRLLAILLVALTGASMCRAAQPTLNSTPTLKNFDPRQFEVNLTGGPTNMVKSWDRTLNVLGYGADPTALTDSTSAIQATLAALSVSASDDVSTNRTGKLFLPPGKYKISDTLVVPSGVILEGAGRDATVITNTSTTKDTLRMAGEPGNMGPQLVVRDLTLSGSYSATAGSGINACVPTATYSPWVQIENVWVKGHANGILLSNMVFSTIKDVKVWAATQAGVKSRGTMNAVTFNGVYVWQTAAGGNGWDIQNANYCSWINCAGEACYGGHGFKLGTTAMATGRLANCSLIACGAESNTGGDGFWIGSSSTVSFLNCYTALNGEDGFHVYGGYGLSFDGVMSQSETRDHLYLEANGVGRPYNVYVRSGLDFNATGDKINHPEWIRWDPEILNNTSISQLGWGAGGISLYYDSGLIGIGTTNTSRMAGYPGFLAHGDLTKLRLEANTDPDNYYFEIQNYYTSEKPLVFKGAFGIQMLQWAPTHGGAGGGEPVLDLHAHVGIDYTNVVGAFAVNGGASIGTTNNAGFGNLLTVGGVTSGDTHLITPLWDGSNVPVYFYRGSYSTTNWPFASSAVGDATGVDQYLTLNGLMDGGTRTSPTFWGSDYGGSFIRDVRENAVASSRLELGIYGNGAAQAGTTVMRLKQTGVVEIPGRLSGGAAEFSADGSTLTLYPATGDNLSLITWKDKTLGSARGSMGFTPNGATSFSLNVNGGGVNVGLANNSSFTVTNSGLASRIFAADHLGNLSMGGALSLNGQSTAIADTGSAVTYGTTNLLQSVGSPDAGLIPVYNNITHLVTATNKLGDLEIDELVIPGVSISAGAFASASVNSTNGYAVGPTNGISATVDVLVSDATTNRLVFVGGILVSNILNYYP